MSIVIRCSWQLCTNITLGGKWWSELYSVRWWAAPRWWRLPTSGSPLTGHLPLSFPRHHILLQGNGGAELETRKFCIFRLIWQWWLRCPITFSALPNCAHLCLTVTLFCCTLLVTYVVFEICLRMWPPLSGWVNFCPIASIFVWLCPLLCKLCELHWIALIML